MKQYLIRGNVDPAAAEIAWEQELFSFAHASREERQNAKKWFGHLCELKESFSELHKIIDRVMLASRVAKFNPLARSELKYRRGEFEDQLEKIDGLVKRYRKESLALNEIEKGINASLALYDHIDLVPSDFSPLSKNKFEKEFGAGSYKAFWNRVILAYKLAGIQQALNFYSAEEMPSGHQELVRINEAYKKLSQHPCFKIYKARIDAIEESVLPKHILSMMIEIDRSFIPELSLMQKQAH